MNNEEPVVSVSNPVHKSAMPKSKLVSSVVALVIVVAAGAYAYTHFFNLTPEQVLAKAFGGLYQQNSYESSFNIVANLKLPVPDFSSQGGGGSETEQSITLTGTGTTDLSNKDELKSDMTVNMETTMLPIKLAVPVRTIGKDLYVQIPNIGAMLAAISPNLKPGDWIHMSESDFTKIAKDFPETELKEADVKRAFESLSLERKKQIGAIISDSHIISTVKELPKEDLNGKSMYHYALTVDQTKFPEVMDKYELLVSGENNAEDKKAADELVKAISFSDVEVWIDPSALLPAKFSLVVTVTPPDDGSSEKIPAFPITISVTYSKFGEHFTIEAPKESKLLSSIMKEVKSLQGGF